MKKFVTLVAVLALAAVGTAGAAGMDTPKGMNRNTATTTTGDYAVTIKVLPAESFTGPKSDMVRDGGAMPCEVGSKTDPNHHLVAFVKEDGKPVENADVTIRYCPAGAKDTAWTSLPVVRMHAAGHGLDTTHYGNNVRLKPGTYEVQVSVNGSKPATADITVTSA